MNANQTELAEVLKENIDLKKALAFMKSAIEQKNGKQSAHPKDPHHIPFNLLKLKANPLVILPSIQPNPPKHSPRPISQSWSPLRRTTRS